VTASTLLITALALLVFLVAIAGILVDVPWWIVWPLTAAVFAALIRFIRRRARAAADRQNTEA
jgi:hypothetical protein